MATPSSEAAYASLQAYKPRTAEETLGTAEAKYDVGGARERVGNLRSLVGNLQSAVEAVDPSVTGRTSGTFTTEGQRQALVSRERQPILGDLAKQQGFLGEEQAELSQSQALASQMATALFNQDQQSYQRLLDQYNAARAAEQAAEQRRQFEEQQRLERERIAAQERASKAAATTSGGYDLSGLLQQAQKDQTLSTVVAGMNAKVGSDGKVSPDTYRRAKNDWVTLGFSAEDFDKKFGRFINSRHWIDYLGPVSQSYVRSIGVR